MSRSQRLDMIDREHPELSLVRQCSLLDISRSSLYYPPVPASAEDLELMALMDRQYPSATLRAGSQNSLLRVQEADGLAADPGVPGQPQAGPAIDAGDGAASHLPAA